MKGYRVEVGEGYALHFAPPRPSVREPVYEGFWAWLAPNAAINVYASGMSLERMLPTGPDTLRIEYLFFFRDAGETGAAEREAALAMCARVTEEDRRICEAVQRNLRAGVYRTRAALAAPRERRIRLPAARAGGARRARLTARPPRAAAARPAAAFPQRAGTCARR